MRQPEPSGHFRQNGFGKIPIIAMTANVFQEDLEKAIDSGMNGHVTKPIDMNAVCESAEKVAVSA